MSARARLFVGLSLLLALLSLCALVLLAVADGTSASASSPARPAAGDGAVVSRRPAAPSLGHAQREQRRARAFTPEPAAPIVSEPDPALAHSHPLGGERARIQHELQLIGALNDALDRGDPAHLRTLLARYREHDPRDVERLQEGYALLADCLEAPGEASRRAAARFYDEARASTLRRFVRRICLAPEAQR